MFASKKVRIQISAVIIVLILVSLYFIFGQGSFSNPIHSKNSQVYTLVNDKISQSAAFAVYLPKGESKDGAEEKISFDPDLRGNWVETDLKDAVVFKPSGKLELGKHYAVTYKMAAGEIKKDFMADEDPRVIDIFPKKDSEADPASAITISFNRPMVPLTTLDELDQRSLPITITPETKGKFKWISTRNLQFIPEKNLIASAHYIIKVNAGIQSVDGLSVAPFEHQFITRPLRLSGVTNNTVRYNQPIDIRFNQPVDLVRTSQGIRLTNLNTGKIIAHEARFGTKTIYDYKTNKSRKIEDRSVVSVYPRTDRFGRKNVWDFETSYGLNAQRAYPEKGDIVLQEPIIANINVGTIVSELRVESSRTNLASETLFDPEGKVRIVFHEPIDLGKSKISSKNLKDVVYGEMCERTGDGELAYRSVDSCKKTDDKTQIILTFNPKGFAPGESVPVNLERIVNAEGLELNAEPLRQVLTVYPVLAITKVTPDNGADRASVKELVVCTNSPLEPKSAEKFREAIKASDYMVFGSWRSAYVQTINQYTVPQCAAGEYVNTINYGLHPDKHYTLGLSLNDVFGQKVEKTISFKTELAPEFYQRFHSLQKIYNVTTPDRTTLTYSAENFDHIDLHVCKVDGVQMVKYLEKQPSINTAGESLECVSSTRTKIDLPDSMWVNHYFQINLREYFSDPRGQYVLSFSHPGYKDHKGQQMYERTFLSVTNLAVAEKKTRWTKYDTFPENTKRIIGSGGVANLYWVNRIGTLNPELGATVKVINTTGAYGEVPQVAAIGTTNAVGVAEFPLIRDIVGAVITTAEESAVISNWADSLNYSSSAGTYKKVYVYTDRPIYRPGQEVFIKGIHRLEFDGVHEIFRDKPIEIKVQNSKGETVLNANLTLNNYGTFSTSVKLPDNAPLGWYNIIADGYYGSFEVEEYVGAAFEAGATVDKEEYIAGENTKIDVNAKYYFGVPLDGGKLEYSFTSQNFYFDRYKDEYFNFGGDWYGCYDCGYGDTFLKRGKTTLDAEGNARIVEVLDFTALFKEKDRAQSKIIVFHGTITDKQGKSVSFQKSFIVHRGEFYAGVKADPYFAAAKQPINVRVKTVDTEGKEVRKGGLTLEIFKVEWKSFQRQEVDGGFYNHYERQLTSVFKKNIGTDGSGNHTEKVTLSDPGEYQLMITGKDDKGNEIESTGSTYIYGAGSVDVRPTNNATLDIKAERKDVEVGGQGNIIIQSPYAKAKALIAVERGKILEYKIVDIAQNIYNHRFDVTSSHVPNVYVSALLLSPQPEIKFGQVELLVNRKDKELMIDVKPNKTAYLPGERVTLEVATRDKSGRGVPAEVSISVADLSVLALKGNPKKDPLLFFYGGYPLAVTTSSNIKNLLEEAEIPTGTKGGGGGEPGDLASKKRGEFKDTAFWQANVTTNAQGAGEVSFVLPDNLTKWQVESLGVTFDTRLGIAYNEITSKKEMMLVPLRPRFVVPGDEFYVGATLFNQTGTNQTLDVSFQSSTLELREGKENRKESVKSGETKTVYFKVKAPESIVQGSHVFTLSAKNQSYNDTVENSISITEDVTYEGVATANSTTDASAQEYIYLPDSVLKDKGGLTMKTSATLAVFLSDALKSLIRYPEGCSCDVAQALSAIAKIKKGLSVKNISEHFNLPTIERGGKKYSVDEIVSVGLDRLYDAQTIDGGFAYYKGLKPDLYLSVDVLNTFQDLKEAGVALRPGVIENTARYVNNTIQARIKNGRTSPDVDTLILIGYALSRADIIGVDQTSINTAILGLANREYVNENASTDALAHLALLAYNEGFGKSLQTQIFTSLENRIDIDSRGAYIKSNQKNLSWHSAESTVKNTALFIKILSVLGREHPMQDKLSRWLLGSRTPDGSWGSAHNTLAVVDAFTDYLKANRETESDFTLDVALDAKTIETARFGKANILAIIEKFIPISQFTPNTLHTLTFNRTNHNQLKNKFYYDLGLKYYLPTESIRARDEGIAVRREFFDLRDTREKSPLKSAKVGQVIRGKLTIVSPKPRNLFTIEDFIPAGFELVNFNLATEDKTLLENTEGGVGSADKKSEQENYFSSTFRNLLGNTTEAVSDEEETEGIYQQPLYVDVKENRDDRLYLFRQSLEAGEYTYEYYIRATTPGVFKHIPAIAHERDYPENFGRTDGGVFTVEQ
jgi:uncharacterized protein YfaS (alpha-2-macroglobulin family)